MARVLILTGDAAEELDSRYPDFRLREGDHQAVVAAPTTRAVKLVVYVFGRELPVGTICHGPQVPAALGLLRGRTTAAFPPLKPDMEQAGAIFVDGPMVSCRGWPDLPQWSRGFMGCWRKRAFRPDGGRSPRIQIAV